MNIWVIIPVKLLLHSKSRLRTILSTEERAKLIQLLLGRTLVILQEIPTIRHTLVVSRDPLILDLAQRKGALTSSERLEDGLNQAVAKGVTLASQEGATHGLILPTDLPCMTAADLSQMLPKNLEDSAVRICSDRRQRGTNALSLPVTTPFRFQFGEQSFARHVQEATRLQRPLHIIQAPNLQFDLDTPEDWQAYRQNLLLESLGE